MKTDDDLREFDALDLDREIPAPLHMQQRWHDSIDLAAQRELREQKKSARSINFMSFFWGAAPLVFRCSMTLFIYSVFQRTIMFTTRPSAPS